MLTLKSFWQPLIILLFLSHSFLIHLILSLIHFPFHSFFRDEAQAKMLALKEKNDKDIAQYKTEFMELERIIDHERKLKEFMRVKGEERAELMEGEMTSRRKKRDEKDKGDKAEETIVVCVNCPVLSHL